MLENLLKETREVNGYHHEEIGGCVQCSPPLQFDIKESVLDSSLTK